MQRFRVFVRKQQSSKTGNLLRTLQNYVGLQELADICEIQGYDLGVSDAESLAQFTALHLADPVCDQYFIQNMNEGNSSSWQQWLFHGRQPETASEILSYETLAAQFTPRAQALQDCWNLWSRKSKAQLLSVRCFWLYLLYPTPPLRSIRKESLNAAHRFLWTPLELQVKNMEQFSYSTYQKEPDSATLPPLLAVAPSQLRAWANRIGLRFDNATLAYIHAYYSGQELPNLRPIATPREPSLSELRILEAYWSDHCRHSTFHTELDWPSQIPSELQDAWNLYQELRRQCHIEDKPQCLMDIAVLGARALKKSAAPYMEAVEISAEINACSVFVDVQDSLGQTQKRLLMFKNETHNHPTEIEPYGGAATCLGGAIRDPLSGRSYVYQALRLSGASSPAQKLSQVRPGKLPQHKICADAARGFSDYGNRIGLASSFVWELYHPGFEAKRFECGLVLGVADPQQVQRLEPQPGDLILLLGGATGRDGIGGASGSSNTHNHHTARNNSSEVQRGNPMEERKLQRFFRRRDVGHLIKRCNDLGAGGLAVAVGEIASNLEVDLAAMPTKYQGLTPAELAVSESQERMAVVLAAKDWQDFYQKAQSEGISIVQLGEVKAGQARFQLKYDGTEVANLARDFLDSSGFARRVALRFSPDYLHPYQPGNPNSNLSIEARLCKILSQPQVASQRGLQHMFDSSIGASTVFQPYPHEVGKVMATYGRSEISAQCIPLHYWGQQTESVQNYQESQSTSLLSFAYDAHLSSSNTFLGAQVAIVQSAAKLLAAGAKRCHTYLSLQEYFPRLESPELWGQASAALLGALQAQHKLGLAAIGGKDSMSGTFGYLKVPPVLSSFAFGTASCAKLRAANWQQSAQYLYVLGKSGQALHNPDYQLTLAYWQYLEELSEQSGLQLAARLVGSEGVLGAIALFSFGSASKCVQLQQYHESYWQPYAADPSFSAVLLASSQILPQNPYLQELASLKASDTSILILPSGIEITLDAHSAVYQSWCHYEKEPGYYPIEIERSPGKQQIQLLQEALQNTHHSPTSQQESGTNGKTHKAAATPHLVKKLRLVVPVFPGSNSEDDMLRSFARAASPLGGLELCSPVINLLNEDHTQRSLSEFAKLLAGAQILALPGGFSASDEPDGSAKLIAAVLREPQVAAAIDQLLANEGLILGICNGFQALIKSGLLPYGRDWQQGAAYGSEGLSITYNRQGRHIADLELCRVCFTPSPWLAGMSGKDFLVPISHGEGRLIMPEPLFERLRTQQQIAAVYHGDVNGSFAGIEALCSPDGRILGKMAHSERCGPMLYRNIPHDPKHISLQQDLFRNGLQYF